MKILLDTHVFIWLITEPGRLRASCDRALAEPKNELFVSAVTVWEIVTKRAKGKLHFSGSPREQIVRMKMVEVPMTGAHCEALEGLPMHHRDPFDRLLVAQALVEGFTLATRDPLIARYQVSLLEA